MEFNSPRLEPWEVADTCVVCGSPYTHRHHIFHGSHRRKFADRYGYVIPLCAKHHNGSDYGIHFNHKMDLAWKQKAQKHFEENYGTREDFIAQCGKSYLED